MENGSRVIEQNRQSLTHKNARWARLWYGEVLFARIVALNQVQSE